jgi:hypothetical protein
MDVYWLEQTQADVPGADDWLSASEAIRLNDMHIAKRRADWRLGRWTAKRALAAYLDVPGDSQAITGMEIRPAPSGANNILRTLVADPPPDAPIPLEIPAYSPARAFRCA